MLNVSFWRRSLVLMFAVAVIIGVLAVPASASPAAQDSGAKQLRFKVTDGYTIVDLSVSGTNQYHVTPSTPWIHKCEYGAISVCPTEVVTKNWWWTDLASIHFKLAHRWAPNTDKLTGSCYVEIDEDSWWDTITVTYNVKTGRCTY